MTKRFGETFLRALVMPILSFHSGAARPFSIIIICVIFLWILATLQRGPPVTTTGIAPYSPWAVLVTWNQSNGVLLNDLWRYRLDFQTFSIEVPATQTLMFYSQDVNIYPGSDVYVSIYAIYRHMNQSLPESSSCRVVQACTITPFFHHYTTSQFM